MLSQGLARLLAQAMHDIEHACRETRLQGNLGQKLRGDRAPLSRLMNHGASGRQCRRDLPGREHEGCVPRRNDTDRTNRRA